jgi:hypothetical protein
VCVKEDAKYRKACPENYYPYPGNDYKCFKFVNKNDEIEYNAKRD